MSIWDLVLLSLLLFATLTLVTFIGWSLGYDAGKDARAAEIQRAENSGYRRAIQDAKRWLAQPSDEI